MSEIGIGKWTTALKKLCLAICFCSIMPVVSGNAFAQEPAPEAYLCQAQAKSLYFNGYAYTFLRPWNESKLQLAQRSYNNGWVQHWQITVNTPSASGNLGACVFNGLLYCFFTTSDGKLQYITVNPSSAAWVGPTTVATGLTGQGAAAAVSGDKIYVLVPASFGFVTGDGKNFTTWKPVFSQAPPSQMMDAVTFYPQGNDPAGILFIYNDGASPRKLRSCVVFPPNPQTVTSETVLPWPSATWLPVVSGNLLLGTSGTSSPGAKAPCVQFYGMADYGSDGNHQGRWELNLFNGTWTFYDITITFISCYLNAFPWYDIMDTKGTMRQTHVLEIYSGLQPGDQLFSLASDWMVPQNNDPTYGWAGTPTATSNASDSSSELRNLWSLVGVVLGPPPFPMNGAAEACPNGSPADALSGVEYGKSQSTQITTMTTSASTISVASGSKIKGGLGEWSLDLSYAHAWTKSHGTTNSVSVSKDFLFGPCSESAGSQGQTGWAIFSAPTMITQWYKLYAYDYNMDTNQGTYLNQDIYTTALGNAVLQSAYFDLANPSNGDYTGLMAGMRAYPNSTSIAGWNSGIPNWDNGGSDWSVTFGDTTNPQMPVLNLGESDIATYTSSKTTLDTKGNTNSFKVKVGDKLNLFGFSETVTVGYSGEWETVSETESEITEDVSCTMNVPRPPDGSPSDYIKSLTVQPYWLQAKTAKAPWIPNIFGGNLPWCITWAVTQFGTAGGQQGGAAPSPVSALGVVSRGKMMKDKYAIVGARLEYANEAGEIVPVSMTADEFNPDNGTSVSLNGHVFSSTGSKGTWTRSGETWKYKTRLGVLHDPFTVELNFADKSWSFSAASWTLNQDILISGDTVLVMLDIMGQYLLSTRLDHKIVAEWTHREKRADRETVGVHFIKGDYNSETGAGALHIKGHIKKNEEEFGDMEIRINEASVMIPLLGKDGFLDALDHGKAVKYESEGLKFRIDFRTGTWAADIEGEQFNKNMAPKNGATNVQIYLGGSKISDQTLEVLGHSLKLSFKG